MSHPGDRDAQILLAAVQRGLISDRTAIDVGARSTVDHPAETLLVSEGHLSAPQVTTLVAGLAAARIAPPPQLGNYRILEPLGQGGMATVYKAEQLSLGRAVALKVIGPPHTSDQTFCERFLREARLVAAINHPNVITCFDAGQDQGFLYMALELVTGGDAGKAVTADGGRLEEKRALAIATDCCHGLIALEAAGLIHRDIKPGNIFLCPMPTGERAKLADLGLARATNGDDLMTAAGASMGTPAFMSPEQANGAADVDIRTDIYALGATLYALLTGKSPYQGTTVWSVMAQVLKDPVPDPRSIQPAISNASASIVIRCLAKDRGERYASPKQLLEDLDAAAAGKPLRHARLLPHPSQSWDPLAAAGPMPRHVTREHPTVQLAMGPAPSDRPRDDLGVESPAGGSRWLILGAVAAVAVAGLAIVATRAMPGSQPEPNAAPQPSIETDLAALRAASEEDPLRPRTEPLVDPDPAPAVTPPPAPTVSETPPTTSALPAPVVAPDPVVAPAPITVPPPTVTTPTATAPMVQPATVAAPAPAVLPVPVITVPTVSPTSDPVVTAPAPTTDEMEPPGPAEIPPEAVVAPQPVEPAVQPPPAIAPAPGVNLAAATAYALTRERELNRNGFRCRIEVLPAGTVAVTILDQGVTDLAPLQGLKIERLHAAGCSKLTGDLSSLTGMPLRTLDLTNCSRITSLRGLRGAPLTSISIAGCTALGPDLSQLAGARLTGTLDLTGCRTLTSLDGLQRQPIEAVIAKDCTSLTSVAGLAGTNCKRLDLRGCDDLLSLKGLEGLPLEELLLDGADRLTGDLSALRGAPLRVLSLRECEGITDLNGLQNAPLTSIDLAGCDGLLSIAALKGLKLTTLDLSGASNLRSLDGLQGVPLVELHLRGCRSLTGDFSAVRGAPLQLVDASYCSQMTSLRGLELSPLRKLILIRNTGITTTVELAGIKGLEIVR